MPYRWSDEYGARFGVMRRDDPFGPVRWFDIDPCYVFHVANAYDDGRFDCAAGSPVSRVVARQRRIRRSRRVLWSWTIDLAAGTVTERQLDDRAVEFPRIDDRLAGAAGPIRGLGRQTVAWSATT